MKFKKIFDPEKAGRPMKVMAFMSGSGTNIAKLLEHRNKLAEEGGEGSPFEVVGIFSDRSDGKCSGERIACGAGIPYFSHDIRSFHKLRGLKRSIRTEKGMKARKEFDSTAANLIRAYDADMIALGGYMSYTTLKNAVNVHPADLAVLDENGARKYVGDRAVRLAILDGAKDVRSSAIWIDEGVDSGPVLVRSAPVKLDIPPGMDLDKVIGNRDESSLKIVVEATQRKLKELGDWQVFPLAIQWISEGRFAFDENGDTYFNGRPVPEGVLLDD